MVVIGLIDWFIYLLDWLIYLLIGFIYLFIVVIIVMIYLLDLFIYFLFIVVNFFLSLLFLSFVFRIQNLLTLLRFVSWYIPYIFWCDRNSWIKLIRRLSVYFCTYFPPQNKKVPLKQQDSLHDLNTTRCYLSITALQPNLRLVVTRIWSHKLLDHLTSVLKFKNHNPPVDKTDSPPAPPLNV